MVVAGASGDAFVQAGQQQGRQAESSRGAHGAGDVAGDVPLPLQRKVHLLPVSDADPRLSATGGVGGGVPLTGTGLVRDLPLMYPPVSPARSKILVAECSTFAPPNYLPPVGRDLKTGQAFHTQCCPIRVDCE